MNDKTIRFIDSHYNNLFTIPDGGSIELTLSDGEKVTRKCKYLDEYHTEVGSNVYHICEFAERMEQNGTKYAPFVSEKSINAEYVEKYSDEFKKDKFYVSTQSEIITMVYYNPDSDAGGQLVYNSMSYNLIKEASKFKNKNEFFGYLGGCSKQTLVDIDTPNFKGCANSFINNKCDYIGSNTDTMKALLKLSGVEKAKLPKNKEMER